MFGNRSYTDASLVAAIKKGGIPEDRALAYLIKEDYGKVKNFIIKHNGSEADAEDVFQDGLTALLMNIRKGSFQGQSSVHTYLFAICKGIWYKRFQKFVRERNYQNSLTVVEEDYNTPEVGLLDQEQQGLLHGLFDRLREKCKEVLLMWSNGFNMEEIAEKQGYSSAQAAMNKKSKCLKQLHQLLSENPSLRTSIREL